MKKLTGVFLADLHMPNNINIQPVLNYIKDLNPDIVILGGDIIDGKGMFMAESLPASQIKMEWYERDSKLLDELLLSLRKVTGLHTKLVFLSGNHENRYFNIEKKYPDAFKNRFDFQSIVKKRFSNSVWVDYNTYDSYYKIGDCIFMHGRIYPQNHAKKYAENLNPYKVVYGHLHSYQAYTIHNAIPSTPARYAVNGGCLTKLAPEWKKGSPNMWLGGFVSFVSVDGETTPTAHLIDSKGRFFVGNKTYGEKIK